MPEKVILEFAVRQVEVVPDMVAVTASVACTSEEFEISDSGKLVLELLKSVRFRLLTKCVNRKKSTKREYLVINR